MKKKVLMMCLILGLAVFSPSMNLAYASDYSTHGLGYEDVGPPHARG
ncbi:hypothetical protein M3193_07560 [Sporosarcina luteola]|nr:hypothetical protein [Sporosarcina luteola]MCM3743999.1 hypothetical protein [Sporosarcina luteola]